MRFPPYFYFRFGLKWLSVGYFRSYCVYYVAECYRTSADDRSATSGSTESEYSTLQITRSTFLPYKGFRIVDMRVHTGSICVFRQTGNGCLSTGSSFARWEVAPSGPDAATSITPSAKEFSVSTPSPSPLVLSIWRMRTCIETRLVWATVTSSLPYIRDRSCPIRPCLSVCNVGVLWPSGWMDQDATWYGGRPRPKRHCVRWGPSSPTEMGTAVPAPLFSPFCFGTVAHLSNY